MISEENVKTRRHELVLQSTIVRHEFAYMLLLLGNHRIFAKTAKNIIFGHMYKLIVRVFE